MVGTIPKPVSPHSRVVTTPYHSHTSAGTGCAAAPLYLASPGTPAAAQGVRTPEPGQIQAAVKAYTGPPATLSSTAAAAVRLIVWCNASRHQIEPDVAAMAGKYGVATPVRDWVSRLVCSQCGARDISFVLTGARQ